MKLKCVIIDDEQYAIDALVDYINQLQNLEVVACHTNPIEALNSIETKDKIDFIFLDIEMPGLGGLELAQMLREKVRYLIFTTSHTSYAIAAFDLKASHYLLKPITFAKFAQTITELLENEAKKVKESAKKKLQFIKGDSKSAYHHIDSDSITYIEAAKNYVVIYTQNKVEQFITYMGLNHIEAALDQEDFIRINKSNLIAKSAIKKIEGNIVKLHDGKIFQLGEKYKPAFIKFLNEHLLRVKL